MKSKLSILIDLSDERSVHFNSDSIIHLAKILGGVNLINVSEIIKKKKKIDPLSINKDLIVHHPNNISELKDILIKKKIYSYVLYSSQSRIFFY